MKKTLSIYSAPRRACQNSWKYRSSLSCNLRSIPCFPIPASFLFILLIFVFVDSCDARRGGGFPRSNSGFRGSDYGQRFFGEGTYYGYTEGGNCAMGRQAELPSFYKRMLAVAINEDQYDNSRSCGACLELRGTGRGIGGRPIRGKFRAYVHDRCPECKRGDLDLSSSGDGRWHISWKFVPCPRNDASIVFEGSNNFYKKIQVRGLRFPPRAVWIAGKRAERSQDNFFISHGWFPYRGSLRVIDVKGNRFNAWINLNRASGVFPLPPRFNRRNGKGGSNGGGGGGGQPKPTPSPKPRKCVPDWLPCSGPANPLRLSCCSKTHKCKVVSYSRYKHCLTK